MRTPRLARRIDIKVLDAVSSYSPREAIERGVWMISCSLWFLNVGLVRRAPRSIFDQGQLRYNIRANDNSFSRHSQ